jgi:2-C-methyl-D-erythritol 4-phosphate cytidylyltransferase
MGFDKLLAPLAGMPLFAHSVRAFAACSMVDRIVVVARPGAAELFQEYSKVAASGREVEVIEGGEERYVSVWNGLQTLTGRDGFVAIHDAARPLITRDAIMGCYELARVEGAACCGAPIPDTVKRAGPDQVITAEVSRDGLWAMQTPQIFKVDLILQAYAAVLAKNEMVTDEVTAVQRLGRKVSLYATGDWNFKVTFPRDVEMAEQVLEIRRMRGEGAVEVVSK